MSYVLPAADSRRTHRPQLTVFLTRRMSLAKWDEIGLLDRELALYARLHQRGVQVAIVSYGGHEEATYARRFPWLEVRYNHTRWPRSFYTRWITRWHHDLFQRTSVFKSNQMSGSEVMLRVARAYGRPGIARAGYSWSDTEARAHGPQSHAARYARQVERFVVRQADRLVVTTRELGQAMAAAYGRPMARTVVIPNFVDTQRFAPRSPTQPDFDLVYVGRMSPEKNVDIVLRVARQLRARLLLIGGGGDQSRLPSWQPTTTTWLARVEHHAIPDWLARSQVFILASGGEGHPKAVLEALACGIPVLASRVPGIDNLLTHRQTGYLCEPRMESFLEGVVTLQRDAQLRATLSAQGREMIERRYALDAIADREWRLIQETLACLPRNMHVRQRG